MKTNQTIALIAALSLGFAASLSAQQNSDDVKQRVLEQARSLSPDDYAFTRTTRSETNSKGKTEKKVTIEKFDPTKPADTRWTLVSIDGAPPSAEQLKSYQKETAKRRIVPGYYRLANYFGSPATALRESGGKTLFRFSSLPKGSLSVLDTDISHNAAAEASVSEASGTPFVEQVRVTVKPMRVKLLMKIDRMENIARYRIGPGGKPVLAEPSSEMSGSGLGQEGTMRNTTTYSDYRAMR